MQTYSKMIIVEILAWCAVQPSKKMCLENLPAAFPNTAEHACLSNGLVS